MVRHRHSDRKYEEVASYRVRHKDYLHLKNLYIMMHEWLILEGYASAKDHKFGEEFYLQRENQQSGREIWWWWRVGKVPDGNSYYSYEMDIDCQVILLKDVEVMHQGQKFKTNWGQPHIKIKARLVYDYQDKWKKHWFLKHINDSFHKRIYKDELDEKKLELYRDAYRLQEAIKTFLKMKTFLPEKELAKWYPAKGLGDVQ